MTDTKRIYFDNASTTFPDARVVEAMRPFLDTRIGNPSSLHQEGRAAKEAVDAAREQTAHLIGATAGEIVFTTSGSEGNNLAIKGVALAARDRGKTHIVASEIEHFSVMHPLKTLDKLGFEVTYVPVDKHGLVSPDDVADALTDKSALVTVMLANSEIGTIEPIAEIGQIARNRGVPLHTDAVAAAGVVPVSVQDLNVDLLTMAAAQFHGPQGVGALYIGQSVRIEGLIEGGAQENGLRAGTENVAGIVGMGKACELAREEMGARMRHVTALRDELIEGVLEGIDDVVLTGHPEHRLPGTASFGIESIEGEALILTLDMAGIAAATGSACAFNALQPSHVLRAMGVEPWLAHGSVLFTLCKDNAEKEVGQCIDALTGAVERLRAMSPL